MKPRNDRKRPDKMDTYCGAILALSLVLLVIYLLRTLGVIAGGPAAWYQWVSAVLGLAVSLFGLLARDLPRGYQRAVVIALIVLYGGVLLYRLFDNIGVAGGGEQGSMLVTASGTEYVLRDDKGREMTFEVDQFAGTLPILDWDPIGDGETSFEVAYSDSLTYIGEQDRVELSVEAETWAQSVDGNGLGQVTFEGGAGMVLEGEKFTFHAALNCPADARYSPFHIYGSGAAQVRIETEQSGILVEGLTDDVPVRVTYTPAEDSGNQFTDLELGYYTGQIQIDLSQVGTSGQVVVTTKPGTEHVIPVENG